MNSRLPTGPSVVRALTVTGHTETVFVVGSAPYPQRGRERHGKGDARGNDSREKRGAFAGEAAAMSAASFAWCLGYQGHRRLSTFIANCLSRSQLAPVIVITCPALRLKTVNLGPVRLVSQAAASPTPLTSWAPAKSAVA